MFFLRKATNFIRTIVEIKNQLVSPEFLLSILGFYTIFIIMRYKSIYSLFLIFGVFVAPFMDDQWILGKIIAVLFIPSVLAELTSIYLYNIGDRIFEINFSFRSIFSFEFVNINLEFILLMSHFMLTLIYMKQALQLKKRRTRQEKTEKLEFFSFFSVIKAIIIKYTDFGSMFILFWIGMYTVNFIHSVLMCFFFIYMLMKVNYLPSSYEFENKSETNIRIKRSFYEMTLVYWRILLGYLEIIILFKYFFFFFYNFFFFNFIQ